MDPLEVVKKFYSDFEEGKIEDVFAAIDDNCVITQSGRPGSNIPWAGTFEGKPRCLEFFKILGDVADWQMKVIKFFPANGEDVVVLVSQGGVAKANVTQFGPQPIVHHWVVRGGKIVEQHEIADSQFYEVAFS